MHNMIFLSHANPEDNEFTRWLALQLARERYPVWCDLTKLLGGEDFWRDIEKAIRERTQKFLYVLSKNSNSKPGPLQELQVAQNVMRDQSLQDFIIPMLIDELPHKEINIQLTRINAIPFNSGWGRGLKILLEKLEQDKILKSPNFTPTAVSAWWRTQFSPDEGISNKPEEYLSNWFPIQALPSNIYFYTLQRSQIGKLEVQSELPYPAFQHNQYLVSFAQADDFAGKLGNFVSIKDFHSFSTRDFLEGNVAKKLVERKQARDFVSRLLRMAWQKMVERCKLPTYELANDTRCFYFTKGLAENDRISFTGVNRETTFRQVVGYKSLKASDGQIISKRFWHFGIQARPLVYPTFVYIIKPHVVFSDDGKNIWESKERMHKARRSQCKDWWNSDWRDRILAAMNWLSNDEREIEIQLGSDIAIQVSNCPVSFISPVSYTDPVKGMISIADEEERGYDEDWDKIEDWDVE